MQTVLTSQGDFDREFDLRGLLACLDCERLRQTLEALLGVSPRLLDADGGIVWDNGKPGVSPGCVPLHGDLEIIGHLDADCEPSRLHAAATLVEELLKSAARYRMTSELHIHAVQEDYEELQRRHRALQESEARYRALSEHLEQRVSEQVKTIESAQRQLYQAEKMASVGQLAAGMAHEINNPIGFIQSNLNTALDYLGRLGCFARSARSGAVAETLAGQWQDAELEFVLEDAPSLLQESLDGARRVARIVAALKGFSRVDSADAIEDADVNEIIRSVCAVADSQVRERAELVLQLEQLPPLRCHAGPIGQLFFNLLINAAQALRERGVIRIDSHYVDDSIRVDVADNGPGIAPDVLPRIFDPFFTTKDVGQGTGLGLLVCNDIAKEHGGRIEVATKPGKGTVFTVWLPLPVIATKG